MKAINLNGNESTHSLDSEFAAFDVPLMMTRGVQKAIATANKNLCRSTGEKNPIRRFRYNDYMAYYYAFMMKVATIREPESFSEAAKDLGWVEAMNEEMQTLNKNETGDLVPHSPHKKAIGCRCIYKMNYNVDGSVNHSKSRLLAKVLRYKLNIDREPDRKETDR